jgi:HSP20 family protein
MSMVKWNPFRELEELQTRMNRLFSDTPAGRTDEPFVFADWAPAVDIQETDKEYTVKADLPEVKKEDVKRRCNQGLRRSLIRESTHRVGQLGPVALP